jgi:tRNA-Thr(GGU) m(6)t(6)A37 methyltransferase TsaA
MAYNIEPVGTVRGGRANPDDDDWGNSVASVMLDPSRFSAEALMGLDAFSHAEIIYVFDQVSDETIESGARHPRGRKDWPRIGIFAQRGKNRPNRLGVTMCEIVSVEGTVLTLRGLDATDGTPVVDIKPVMSGFQPRGDFREPLWAREIMAAYW